MRIIFFDAKVFDRSEVGSLDEVFFRSPPTVDGAAGELDGLGDNRRTIGWSTTSADALDNEWVTTWMMVICLSEWRSTSPISAWWWWSPGFTAVALSMLLAFYFAILKGFVSEEHRERCVFAVFFLSQRLSCILPWKPCIRMHCWFSLFFLLILLLMCVFFVSLSIMTYLSHSGIPFASWIWKGEKPWSSMIHQWIQPTRLLPMASVGARIPLSGTRCANQHGWHLRWVIEQTCLEEMSDRSLILSFSVVHLFTPDQRKAGRSIWSKR